MRRHWMKLCFSHDITPKKSFYPEYSCRISLTDIIESVACSALFLTFNIDYWYLDPWCQINEATLDEIRFIVRHYY